MGGDRLLDTIELRYGCALSNSLFIRFHGFAACQEAAAMGDDGLPCKLSIRRQRHRIGNGAIQGDPISLCHFSSPEVALNTKAQTAD